MSPYGEMTGFHSSSLDVKYKFNGHEYDAESGLYYMGARYYDPKLGRFISADTVVQFPFYPQSLNRYSFALNNPIVIRELDGNCGTAPSGFWSSVKSFFSSIGRAVASFARGAVSVAVSFARAGANIVIGGASLVAGVTVGVLTGGNGAAMRAVFSGADSLRGAINNGANNAIASLGGGGDIGLSNNNGMQGDKIVDPTNLERSSLVRETGSGFDLGDFIEGWRDYSNFFRGVKNFNEFWDDVKRVAYSLDVSKTQKVDAIFIRTHGGENMFEYSHMYAMPSIYNKPSINEGVVQSFIINGQRNAPGFFVPPTIPSYRKGSPYDL